MDALAGRWLDWHTRLVSQCRPQSVVEGTFEPRHVSGGAAMTLTEFLLQRIAQDEAAARLRYDRIVAECEAKRRVAELVAHCEDLSDEDWAVALEAARTLAAIHADHPDYDPEWQE